MPIQNSFIFREPQWGSAHESFIQKCWLLSEIQSFKVENYFLMPFSLWNCTFLTIFDFKALYFWNWSIFLNETFRRDSSLRFPENEAILDGRGNYLMPATPIFRKHCFFKKFSKNPTNLAFFVRLIGLFKSILFFFTLSGWWVITRFVLWDIKGYAPFFPEMYLISNPNFL